MELAMEVSVSKLARSMRWWSCCGCSSSAELGVWPMAAGERGMLGMLLGAGRGVGRGGPPLAMYWNGMIWRDVGIYASAQALWYI